MNSSKRLIPGSLIATAVTLALATQAAQAQTVYLRAVEYTKDLPTTVGTTVPVTMWGYRVCADETLASCAAPGPVPVIRVPAGDTSLLVHLQNDLPAGRNYTTSTSLYVPGQAKKLNPERWPAGDPNYGGRIRSLDTEVAPGATLDFQWTSLKAGTYLFHSGTHPQVQVQMGLYGALVVEAPSGEVYPGVAAPAHEDVLVLSEVDPDLHAAVAANQYGPGAAMTSTVNYNPRFFLINGEPYSDAQQHILGGGGFSGGDTMLLRLVNAGLETHSLQLLGGHLEVIAEDGHPRTRMSQYTTLLPAGKTLDTLFTPSAGGSYKLFDRSLRLVNDTATPGGIFASISVGGPGYQHPPVARPDFFFVLTNDLAANAASPGSNNYSALFNSAGLQGVGVLANDFDIDSNGLFVNEVTHESTTGPVTETVPNGGNGLVWTDPSGWAMSVRRTGAVRFYSAATDWVGVAAFQYDARDNTPLLSDTVGAHVVHDMHVRPVFHNPSGTTSDRWDLSGTLRTMPVGNVTVTYVANTGATVCARVGEEIVSVAPVASATGATWSYAALMPNDANCNRIRVSADLPAADGVWAHTAQLDVNIQRVNP